MLPRPLNVGEIGDTDVRLRTVVDRAAKKVEGRFADQPEAEIGIRRTLSVAYKSIGRARESRKHIERAYELSRNLASLDPSVALDIAVEYASYIGSETMLLECLSDHERLYDLNDTRTDYIKMKLAEFYWKIDKLDEGMRFIESVVERFSTTPVEAMTLRNCVAMNLYAHLLADVGRNEEAIPMYRRAYEVSERIEGANAPNALVIETNTAGALAKRGDYIEALDCCLPMLERRKQIFGTGHAKVYDVLETLYSCLRSMWKSHPEQFPQAIDAVERYLQANPSHDTARLGLALAYDVSGEFDQAVEQMRLSMTADAGRGERCMFALFLAKAGKREAGLQVFEEAESAADSEPYLEPWLKAIRRQAAQALQITVKATRAQRVAWENEIARRIELTKFSSSGFAKTKPMVERIYSYSAPQQGMQQSVLWSLSTPAGGRPFAIMATNYGGHVSDDYTSTLEFVSLSDSSYSLEGDETKWVWTPSGPGVQFAPVPRAAQPASEASERSSQISTLAERFKSHLSTEPKVILKRTELPVVRYSDPAQGIVDGAIFWLSQGDNPEVALLLEARTRESGLQWEFALARLSAAPLVALVDEEQVWSVESSLGAPGAAYWIAAERYEPE